MLRRAASFCAALDDLLHGSLPMRKGQAGHLTEVQSATSFACPPQQSKQRSRCARSGDIGSCPATHSRTRETPRMLPLYAARIEDLGRGDLVKVDCADCHHVVLLTQEALLRVGLSPACEGARPKPAKPEPNR